MENTKEERYTAVAHICLFYNKLIPIPVRTSFFLKKNSTTPAGPKTSSTNTTNFNLLRRSVRAIVPD